MADSDHLDYRLRCHTKRTDLPVDVLRDIGEAYAEIMHLRRELDTSIAMFDMRSEKIIELTIERDEARREVCRDEAYRPSPSPPCTANQVADRRGWDCFKDYKKSQEALDKLAQLDEELGLQ